MYLDFYNLKKEPFHITPDPEFLFLSPSHKEALASIIYGIEQKKGFVEIVGGVGLGKTTVLRSYLEQADRDKLRIIYVFNAGISFENLLKTIYGDLGLPGDAEDTFAMVNKLHESLIVEYEQGRNVVLIIDEAQNMPIETLENLRMLSNLETSTDKLMQIILIGQTELDEILNLHQLRQLKQRIAIRAVISPLTFPESLAYVNHRLSIAGMMDTPVFTAAALQHIVRCAHGIPRIINILCDNALITGLGYEVKPISAKIAKEIIADFEGKKKTSSVKWWVLIGCSAVILLLVSVYLLVGGPLAPKTHTAQSSALKPQPQETQSDPRAPTVTPGEKVSPTGQVSPVKVVIKKGDTLQKLTRDVYGFTGTSLLEKVKQSNPHIKDVNIIKIDEEILFPPLEGGR
jgi:general secretion pathway protein A